MVIIPVLNGISRVNPLITGVITHLLSGMSHQVRLTEKMGLVGVSMGKVRIARKMGLVRFFFCSGEGWFLPTKRRL